MAKLSVARPARSLTDANQAIGICVDHRRNQANMIKPKCEPAARPACKLYEVGKNSPTVLNHLWTKFGWHVGESL